LPLKAEKPSQRGEFQAAEMRMATLPPSTMGWTGSRRCRQGFAIVGCIDDDEGIYVEAMHG
jgi:hypothetical protein